MDIISNFKEKAQKVEEALKNELKKVRANRPNASLVEDLMVDYYNNKTPLKHLSSITVQPPREIHIQVWDKEAMKPVLSAIDGSDLGFSANTEGDVIRIFLPELSQERRDELIKSVKKSIEEFKIQVRNIRDEAKKDIDEAFDDSDISEDDKFRMREELQKETGTINNKIDKLLEDKKKEIEL
ncbi:MAG: ribosome recycling factor [Candidatus Paceibacterota bacterium]